MEEKYILALDIGTSTIRSYIYNSTAETVGKAVDQVMLHYPSHGFVEIDPDELWKSVIEVVQKSLIDASLSIAQMTGMGISTQRSTFITWSRQTGLPFHRFITWKDMRSDKLVQEWNRSITFRLFKMCSYILYLLTRSKRFKAGSVFKFMNSQTSLRLSWVMQNVSALKTAIETGDAMFGTLDTWLLYKLTGGRLHMSDVSSASATGLYDPFAMEWAGWATRMLGLPAHMFPRVVDTSGPHFTHVDPAIWGAAVPIRSCMADQTASMWGSCCFSVGDVKLTLGTGTFLDINTGCSPHASVSGLYPVVGWRVGKELVYAAEGTNNDTASIVKWAQSLGLFDNPAESAAIASSVPHSDGVYFIPAFSGLGPPYNDGGAASGFIGVKPSTTKAHLVRAVLESLAFRTAQLYECVCDETHYHFTTIRLDGGVSNNDFIAQLISDLTGLTVERPRHVEMSSLGCAHIVGLHLGIWKSKEELKTLHKVGHIFRPRPHIKRQYTRTFAQWQDAAQRMRNWYQSGTTHDDEKSDCNIEKSDCNIEKSDCNTQKSDCNIEKSDCNTQKSDCNIKKSDCNIKKSDCNIEKSDCNTQKSDCNIEKSDCNIEKSDCNTQKSDCNIEKSDCNIEKSYCNTQKSDCNIEKSDCNIEKSDCNTQKSDCNIEKSDCNTQKSDCNIEKSDCNTHTSHCNIEKSNCNTHEMYCNTEKNDYNTHKNDNDTHDMEFNIEKSHCNCNIEKSDCNTHKSHCNTHKSDCHTHKSDCNTQISDRNTDDITLHGRCSFNKNI